MNEQVLQGLIRNFINYLPYAMALIFVVAATFRWVIYYTVRRHEWFSKQFEARVYKFLDSDENKNLHRPSFYVLTKKILERSFYESFAVRDRKSVERFDGIMSVHDRLFLVKQGCAWMVKDILKQLRYLKWSKETPKLEQITRATLHHNPVFTKIFGVIPMTALNDLISILPGLFIVAGILGTFLGIKGGLVSLGGMDMSNVEGTKTIMDSFLHEIGFAMSTSIAGITFSLALHFVNTSFSPDRVFVSLVDRFENALDLIWYRSETNDVPAEHEKFDEHRDPTEALAEEALQIEISKSKKSAGGLAA